MDMVAASLALAGLFVAGIIKGATGLGYASSALPFLVMAVGLRPAMAIVILPVMATNVGVALSAGHFWETARRFQSLYVAMLPGIVIGIWALQQVDQAVAVRVLGAVMALYGILALMRPAWHLPRAWEAPLQVPTGFLNGIVTGLTGAQVMPLFPYMLSLKMNVERTVQAVNLCVLIATSVLGVGLIVGGIMTQELFAYSVLGTVPALAGVAIGNDIRQRLQPEQFRRAALFTLLTLGATMLMR
jgi:uncharacterized protein